MRQRKRIRRNRHVIQAMEAYYITLRSPVKKRGHVGKNEYLMVLVLMCKALFEPREWSYEVRDMKDIIDIEGGYAD